MDSREIRWCDNCKKFVIIEGKLDRQGLSNVCLECGAIVNVVPYSKIEQTQSNNTKIPSDKTVLRWWDEQPKGVYTCSMCGREDFGSIVQPQHPGFMRGVEGIALCGNCVYKIHEQNKTQHKKDLGTLPRCEVPGCNKRGTWRVGGHTLLCGWHLKNYKANASTEELGIFTNLDYSKKQILEMAVTK